MLNPLNPTCYRNIFLLLLLVAVMTNPAFLFAQQKEKDLQPGRLRIKVSPAFASQLQQARVRTARVGKDNVMLFGIRSLDVVHKQFKVNNLKRVFRDAGVFEAKHRKYGLDRWYEITMDSTQSVETALAAFGGIEEVEKVEPVYRKHLTDVGPQGAKAIMVDAPPTDGISANGPNDPLFSNQWHYNNTGQTGGRTGADIRILNAWQLETGNPDVVVAVMDGGIQYDHPDLAANMWRNLNEIPGNAIDDDNNGYVDDIYGYGFGDDVGDMVPDMHGTHVGGTIAAVTNNGIGVAGVAGGSGNGDGVRLMSCAVFGRTNVDHFPESYVYAADMGAVISQNSWGYNWGYEQVVLDAIDYFIAEAGKDIDGNQVGPMNGGTVVFAAGNWSTDFDAWPGMHGPVVAVAALMHNDVRAPYSNYGFWIDIAAPGGFNEIVNEQGVLSTLTPSSYGYLQGTSMACPHVSGVAALLISKFGGMGYDHTMMESRLISTTDDINPLNPNFSKRLGSGRLNATKALYIPDSLAPLPIQDLSISSIMHNSLTVAWTSPTDANDFPVTGYDLRYSTNPITPENFNAATSVDGVPPSDQQGVAESFTIDGLTPNTTYYTAIKSIDNAGHVSELSSVIQQRTYLPPVLEVSSYVVEASLQCGQTRTRFITLSNSGEAPLHYTFIYTQPEESHIALVEPRTGVIAAGDSEQIQFTFRSLYLVPGQYSMDVVLTTNDPNNSGPSIYTNLDLNPSTGPVVEVDDELDFGKTVVNETKRLNIHITNAGHPDVLVIDTIYFDSDLFSTPVTFPITILDFNNISIPIDFKPTSPGNVQATIIISVDHWFTPDKFINLNGEGYDPYGGISVRPQSLSETLEIGETSTQALVVRNNSDVPVPIVVKATHDFFNTLPPTSQSGALQEHTTGMKSADAGLEALAPAWPAAAASMPTQAAPFYEYATDFENFTLGTLHGQSGWAANSRWRVEQTNAASGENHLRYTPPIGEYYPFIFTPLVDVGSAAKSSFKVNVDLGTATNNSWQIAAGSPRTGYVITRILIDYQRALSALVNDGNGLYHLEPIPVTAPEGYFEIALEVSRATHEFSIYLNGENIFSGLGFTGQADQLLFYAANDGTMDIDNVQIIDGALESTHYLSINPSTTTIAPGDSVSLAVSFDARNLTYSDYESFISIQSAGATNALSVPVLLSITGDAKVETTGPVTASLTTGTDTTAQLSIVNAGGLPITYATNLVFPGLDSAWITVHPATGHLPVATTAATILTIDASHLAPGEYSAILVITSNAPTVEVPVTVNVTTPAKLEVESEHLAFQNESHQWYDYLNFRNTGGSRLYYTVETSTTFRDFHHTVMSPLNNHPVSPGPNGTEAIANAALPFVGESYDDELLNFIYLGNMNGQDGWAADGNEWFGMSPSEYVVNIQGKSNGTGTSSMMFSPVVDQGSENVSSISMNINLMGAKGTTWQFIPQSPTQGQVVTRLQINPDQSMQVLVKNSDGSASFQHLPTTVVPQFFDLTIKVDRLTSTFAIFFDGQRVFTGQGFTDQIEQMAFLSLMEKQGSSIFLRTYQHYNCASTILFSEDWYWTNETSGYLDPGGSVGMYVTYAHTDLDLGEYIDSIKLTTNDPTNPIAYVPFTITVHDPYVEPADYKLSRGLEILTDSLFADVHAGDSTTAFVRLHNPDDVPRTVYFPVPVELDHEYRAYYNRSANFKWQDISSTGIKLVLGDDDSESIQLPFVFYIANGVSSDYFTISSNGYLAHGVVDAASPINPVFGNYHEDEVYNRLGIYWDDLVTDEFSGIYYSVDDEKLIVQYDNVLIYGTNARNTFQAIVYKDGTIKYQYLSMDDRFGASVGLSNGYYYPMSLIVNQPFVTDSLAIVFQYETAPQHDEETGFPLYVSYPWIKYPSTAITIQPHSTMEVPIGLSGLSTGVFKGNITLLSYETSPYNYPDWYFGRIDDHAFVVPVAISVLGNPPPVLQPIDNITVAEGTQEDITFTATDPNDAIVNITLQNAPPFISLKSTTSNTATYTIAPLRVPLGTYAIPVTATDPHGASDTDTLHISVVQYSVTSFSMINVETGEVLFDFTDGVTINRADPNFSMLTIRANTSPEVIGSVKFKIDGSQINIDNTNPYQLKNRQLLSLTQSEHTILAEPFTQRSALGFRGESKQATITIIQATNVVVDFSLVNVVTGEVILNFDDALTIDRTRPDFMNLNIRANTLPDAVGSVKFKVGGAQRNIDSSNPYLLKSGFLSSLIAGDYTILAEPFAEPNGHGERGQGKQAIVTIREAPVSVIDFSLINVVSGEVISHFTNTITLNRNRPDLANLTIRANTGPSEVPSVKFKVNGSQRNIDSATPYLLKTQLLPTLPTGENILLAEPFSEPNGHGTRGESREAKIILEDAPATVSFSLVNVVTGQILETFDQFISIDRLRADFANLNIRANTAPAVVGSVKFKINGSQRNIDSGSPYLLANQSLQNLPTGNTQLYGEPFTLSNGHGSHGQPLEATITLTEGATASAKATAAITESTSAKATIELYPVPVADVLRFKTAEYENRAFQIGIVNVMGQTVFRSQVASGMLNGFEVSTNSIGMGSGVYYVHLVDAAGLSVIKKIVKQ
jgi:subtilisin family serine protease